MRESEWRAIRPKYSRVGRYRERLGNPQFRRARTRVAVYLGGAGALHAARCAAQRRYMAAGTDRLARRTDAVARLGRDVVLDLAVLERVEGDHHEAPAGAGQHALGARERRSQLLDLVVDLDADRLERLRRGVDTPSATTQRRLDGFAQIGGHEGRINDGRVA